MTFRSWASASAASSWHARSEASLSAPSVLRSAGSRCARRFPTSYRKARGSSGISTLSRCRQRQRSSRTPTAARRPTSSEEASAFSFIPRSRRRSWTAGFVHTGTSWTATASTQTRSWRRRTGLPRACGAPQFGCSTGSWRASRESVLEQHVAIKNAQRTNGSSASHVRFERIRQVRAHEYVAEQIRRHIALRLIKPGEALPAERELAGMFGVGRPTIQHALRLLEAAGLVEARRGRLGGTFITHPDEDSLAADDLIVRVMRQRKELEDLLL